MVVFINLISKKRAQGEKLDHLLEQQPKVEEKEEDESLEAFRTQASTGRQALIASSSSGVSFSWVERALKVLNGLETGFMSLIEELDCPMMTWQTALADEYFTYTSHLLDAFNSITAALAHLQGLRLALAHALTSPSSTALLSFAPSPRSSANWAAAANTTSRRAHFHGNERRVYEALLEMEAVAVWVCSAILSGLGAEMDMDNDYGELVEVKEVNEMVSRLKAGYAPSLDQEDELEEMKTKVESFQRQLEAAAEDVNCLFDQVSASRNKLMDCFRMLKE